MIISHDYKFIFIKTNKTAGTSIEIALSRFCGPNDIITTIPEKDEEIRRSLGYRGPQNYLVPSSEMNLQESRRLARKGKKERKYYNHISANRIRRYIGQPIWDSYFKFCVERNPWDRLISMYYWHCKSEPRPTIAEFLDSDIPLRLKLRGRDLYMIDGRVAVDVVCRFESLSEDLEKIRLQLGIPEKLELPRTKSTFRKDKRNYREILSDAERARIAELFAEEIDLIGYQY